MAEHLTRSVLRASPQIGTPSASTAINSRPKVKLGTASSYQVGGYPYSSHLLSFAIKLPSHFAPMEYWAAGERGTSGPNGAIGGLPPAAGSGGHGRIYDLYALRDEIVQALRDRKTLPQPRIYSDKRYDHILYIKDGDRDIVTLLKIDGDRLRIQVIRGNRNASCDLPIEGEFSIAEGCALRTIDIGLGLKCSLSMIANALNEPAAPTPIEIVRYLVRSSMDAPPSKRVTKSYDQIGTVTTASGERVPVSIDIDHSITIRLGERGDSEKSFRILDREGDLSALDAFLGRDDSISAISFAITGSNDDGALDSFLQGHLPDRILLDHAAKLPNETGQMTAALEIFPKLNSFGIIFDGLPLQGSWMRTKLGPFPLEGPIGDHLYGSSNSILPSLAFHLFVERLPALPSDGVGRHIPKADQDQAIYRLRSALDEAENQGLPREAHVLSTTRYRLGNDGEFTIDIVRSPFELGIGVLGFPYFTTTSRLDDQSVRMLEKITAALEARNDHRDGSGHGGNGEERDGDEGSSDNDNDGNA